MGVRWGPVIVALIIGYLVGATGGHVLVSVAQFLSHAMSSASGGHHG